MKDPQHKIKHLQALPRSDGQGHQVTYEQGPTRRVHQFQRPKYGEEPPPHGAGSFHDPDQHQRLMDRVESMLRKEDGA